MLCIATAFLLVSCIRDNGNDDNTPYTEESLVGKAFYTNSYWSNDDWWHQTQIRFGANNTAYLTRTRTKEEGEVYTETDGPVRASYNLFYPNIVFEDEDGNSYAASFVDGQTLVISRNGGNLTDIEEELELETPKKWEKTKGWHFRTNPQTITGPYLGQYFVGGLTYDGHKYPGIKFYANIATVGRLYDHCEGKLNVDYPNFTVTGSGYISGEGNAEGYFVDANTIVLTKLNQLELNDTLTKE